MAVNKDSFLYVKKHISLSFLNITIKFRMGCKVGIELWVASTVR